MEEVASYFLVQQDVDQSIGTVIEEVHTCPVWTSSPSKRRRPKWSPSQNVDYCHSKQHAEGSVMNSKIFQKLIVHVVSFVKEV